MHREMINYRAGEKDLRGYLCYSKDIRSLRPGVMVAHAWYGLDDFAKQRAEELARMGYIAFAADLFGNDQEVRDDAEAASLMGPLFLDRRLLQERIKAGYRVLSEQSLVDKRRIGAIGYCFGGLTVIELLRSGTPVRGVVSFHGGVGKKSGDKIAKTVPIASRIEGAALLLHGHDDPSVTQDDLTSLENELTQAKVDWTLTIYGHTSHAFTNPEANNPSRGLLYNEKAARRSWTAMQQFFDDIFKF